tara:strand:- start:158 stop:1480 length:1323 start_codon:yes stop_codon:yes gene_type:complete
MTIYDDTDTSDYLKFQVDANGASTISTNDNDGSAGDLTFSIDGEIIHKKVSDDANGPEFVFEKQRSDTTIDDNDYVGRIQWRAYDDQGTPEIMTAASMYVRVLDASSNDEKAEMVFKVLADEFTDDDTPTTFLSATGLAGAPFGYVQVNLGSKSGSSNFIHGLTKFTASNHGSEATNGKIHVMPYVAGTHPHVLMESAADNGDFLKIAVEAAGASTISTVDDGGEAAHLKLDADGEIFLEPYSGGVKIKETDDKVSETAGYGQLWVKDDAPNTLWFTDDADNDYKVAPMSWTVNGADPIYGRMSSVNNWYIGNQNLSTSITAADWTTFRFNYAQFTAITPVVLNSWYFVGEFSSSVDWEIELWDVTIPSNGTAAPSTVAKVGSTQSVSATAYAIYTIGETGLDYTVDTGHQLYYVVRYTSGSGTKYTYGTATMEFSQKNA